MPVALVLSAGGMFGAYQAGAWNVLSQHFQPDLVAGTSVGALNGWAIAGGCSAAELMTMWQDPSTSALMRRRFSVFPWNGYLDPTALERHVRDWHRRFQPRVPFSITVVQVPQLRLLRVPHERITPQHLMASCAIPLGYPPVRIDGQLLVDGGLLDLLPVWAAVQMGATRVVAVNALPLMPSLPLRAALRVAHVLGQKPPAVEAVSLLSIAPRRPLGSIAESITGGLENVRKWIRQGEDDAAAAIPNLAAV